MPSRVDNIFKRFETTLSDYTKVKKAEEERDLSEVPHIIKLPKGAFPSGKVPEPPEKGVRTVRRSIPRRMSLHSLRALTAMCTATRPTNASKVDPQYAVPS